MRISNFLLFILFSHFLLAKAQKAESSAVLSYIDQYASISMELMRTTGVPASIKLAQGILESNSGRSTLAVEANNHFGIKCGSTWTGPTYYRKDDDRDKNGKLKPSCFRVFEHAQESFRRHSDFLTDPRKKYRYGFLFDLDPLDYKRWAHGLKKAGYATNPKYAGLLIKLIEDYKLYEYDRQALTASPAEIVASGSPQESTEVSAKVSTRRINGLEAILYDGTVSLEDLASMHGLESEDLYRYNDWSDSKPRVDDLVYIQAKPLTYNGSSKKHVFSGRESISEVAQRYGVQAAAISELLSMRPHQRPKKGTKLKFKKLNRYFSAANNRKPAPTGENGYLFEYKVAENRTDEGSTERKTSRHTVQTGETLFSISRLYGLDVDHLVRMNDLKNKELKPGMVLKIIE